MPAVPSQPSLKLHICFPGFYHSGVQGSLGPQLLQLAPVGPAHGQLLSAEHDDQLLHQLLHLLLHVLRLQGRPLRGLRQGRAAARMREGERLIRMATETSKLLNSGPLLNYLHQSSYLS